MVAPRFLQDVRKLFIKFFFHRVHCERLRANLMIHVSPIATLRFLDKAVGTGKVAPPIRLDFTSTRGRATLSASWKDSRVFSRAVPGL